jgi:hypothetical protein
MLEFFQLLGAIKGCFNGQSLNFMCTQYVGSYYFGLKQLQLPKGSSHVLRQFLESWNSGILIPFPNRHLGSFLIFDVLNCTNLECKVGFTFNVFIPKAVFLTQRVLGMMRG